MLKHIFVFQQLCFFISMLLVWNGYHLTEIMVEIIVGYIVDQKIITF